MFVGYKKIIYWRKVIYVKEIVPLHGEVIFIFVKVLLLRVCYKLYLLFLFLSDILELNIYNRAGGLRNSIA